MSKISEIKEVLEFLKKIKPNGSEKSIKYTREEIREVFEKLEKVFVFYENNEEKQFNKENKEVLENILRKTSPIYTGTRRSQKLEENFSPFMMHFLNVAENAQNLYDILKTSNNKTLKIQIEDWFQKIHIENEEQKHFFLTTISLLHDVVEDFYKQAIKWKINCKRLNNCSNNLINLAQNSNQTEFLEILLDKLWIKEELEKVFDKKQIEAIKTALNDLNMVGGLEFNEQTKNFKNPKKLINYFDQIWEHPFSIFIKTADLLDNTHWHITDKQLLKYTIYAISMWYKNTTFLDLMKIYLKDFEYKDSSKLDEFIDKANIASKFLKYYKQNEKNIWFTNIEGIDFEKDFLNNLAYFVAYNDINELEKVKKEILSSISETQTEIHDKYNLNNANNKEYKNIQQVITSNDKLLLNIAFINIFYLFSLLKRKNNIDIFIKNNKPQLSSLKKQSLNNITQNFENNDILKNLFQFFFSINIDLFTLILSTNPQIKAREKTFSSISWKLIREPKRWNNVESKWSLWDHFAYAIIFNNFEDAQIIAEILTNLWDDYKIEYSDRWLLENNDIDEKELTTIDIPFCNFKISYKWTYLFELSIRTNPINFVKDTIKRKNINTEKEKIQLIVNAFEPIEHSLYKSVEDVLTIPYLKENFFSDKNILNYENNKQFENTIDSIFMFYFIKITTYLKENPDNIELLNKHFSWIKGTNNKNYKDKLDNFEKIVKEIFFYKLLKLACKKNKDKKSDFLQKIINYSKTKLEDDYKKKFPNNICEKYE